MAQFGKSAAKRGKPSYVYAIIGVALVLFLFGLVGWISLNLQKTGKYFKENIQLHTFIYRTAQQSDIDSLKHFIESLPYAINMEYITRDMAIAKYNAENDTLWKQLKINNPLPESIDFYVKEEYVNKDSLSKLEKLLLDTFPTTVSEFQTPEATVASVSQYVKTITIVLLVIAIMLSLLVIVSIDNTIRLAMYSNRFLIKTMQMVGATRRFITRPLDRRALVNGLISAIIAIVLLSICIYVAEKFIPALKVLHTTGSMLLIFGGIILLGILISVVSTHRSALKYLKMKLDELY